MGRRLKRQLIDRQGRPGNTPPDVSTWRGMFTDLTSAAITSRQRIFFKAAVNQTRQNVYHCEFSRQIQTKLQPQTCLRPNVEKKKTTCQTDQKKKKSPVKLLRTGGIFPWYYQFPCTTNHFYDYFLLHFFFCFFFGICGITLPRYKKALASTLDGIDDMSRRVQQEKSIESCVIQQGRRSFLSDGDAFIESR